MERPDDLQEFLASPWVDSSICHLAAERLVGRPVYFFVLYGSGSGQQTLDAEIEQRRSKVIQQLAREAGVTTVFIEGTDRSSPRSWLSSPEEADRLLAAGTLKAEEHAQAVSPVRITLLGIDNMKRYRESAEALSEWRHRGQARAKALATVENALKARCEQCSSELRLILETKSDYEQRRVGLAEYAQFLAAEAYGAGVTLDDCCSLTTLLNVVSQEGEIDFQAAEREREMLQSELGPALSDPRRWIGGTLEAFAPHGLSDAANVETIQEDARQIDEYVRASPERMRAFRESLFYRIAMYGAYSQGLDAMEKRGASPREFEKAFAIGMLHGPSAIGELVRQHQESYLNGNPTAADIYAFALDLAIFAGFDETRIPNMIRYCQYTRRYQAVQTYDLFQQIGELEKEVSEAAVITDHDKEFSGAYWLFQELKERVELAMSPGKECRAFKGEKPENNRAVPLKRSRLLAPCNKAVFESLDALDEIECTARRFYSGSMHRGHDMAQAVQRHASERHLDRAVIAVGGFHTKSMIDMFKIDPSTSYIVILPTEGRTARSDMSFADAFAGDPSTQYDEGRQSKEEDIPEDFANAPQKLCDNVVCRFSAPAIVDRVVCLTDPGSRATFYCSTCKQYYCGLELRPIAVPAEKMRALPESDSLRALARKLNREPFTLACRHCGDFVGQGERTIIWAL